MRHPRAEAAQAFFELYVHELLLRLEYAVEVHPLSPAGEATHPDFLGFRRTEGGLFVEARVTMDQSEADAAAQARINQAYDALNRLDSPDFFLNIGEGEQDVVQPGDPSSG